MGRIGHASIDEKGKIVGAQAGDQTTQEICTRAWYDKNWNVYLECTDEAMADRAANYMEAICANDNYGYSQPNRWKGYQSIMAAGKDVSKGKGDFDCSSLILSCYIFAGLDIKPDGYTGNMRTILLRTGKFKAYTASSYLKSDSKAKRGGIYLKEGSHVVMCLKPMVNEGSKPSNGTKVQVAAARFKDASKAGTYTVTASKLNMRANAGTDNDVVDVLDKGEEVKNYGYYSKDASGKVWLYIKHGNDVGYCSVAYLKKK